jgi:hypothetical protein
MAIEKKIDIIVDVSDAVTDVNKLDNSMKALDKTTQSLGSSQQATRQNVLDNGGAMGLLNDATGGLAMTFKDAVEASSLFGKQSKIGIATQKAYTFVMGTSTGAMKAFKLALIGTGIGALVVGVGLLIANFDKVKDAVMKLIPGFKMVADFIGGIVESITDFIGITSDMTRELDKMAEQATRTLDKNKLFLDAYGDQYDEFTKRKIEANNTYAEHVKTINENEELSEAEKLSRLKLLRERADRDIDQADADREAKRNEARQKEIDEANAKAKQDAQLRQQERERIQKEAFDFAVKMADMERTIQEEKRVRDAQIAEEDDAKEKAQYDKEIAALVAASAKKKEIEQQELDAKRAFESAKLQIVDQTFGLISALAGESKEVAMALLLVEKGLAISQVVTNASRAIAQSTANLAATPAVIGVVPNPAYAIQAAATAKGILTTKISAGLAIGNILAQTIGKLSGGNLGGGSSSGGGGGQAPSAPSFNLVGGTGINQIAQGLGQQQQPIQAYVVSGNVTSAQALDRNIVNTASVG